MVFKETWQKMLSLVKAAMKFEWSTTECGWYNRNLILTNDVNNLILVLATALGLLFTTAHLNMELEGRKICLNYLYNEGECVCRLHSSSRRKDLWFLLYLFILQWWEKQTCWVENLYLLDHTAAVGMQFTAHYPVREFRLGSPCN